MEVALVREDTCHHWAFLDVTVGFRMIEVKIWKICISLLFWFEYEIFITDSGIDYCPVITDLEDCRRFGRCSLAGGRGDN